MRIALNIADLTNHGAIVPLLVGPVVSTREMVDTGRGHLDGMAVILECPEGQGRAIAQVLRNADRRAKRAPLRVYLEGRRGGWRKVPNGEILA